MNIDDGAKIALGLPDVSEGTCWGNRTWFVAGKGFAWERPLSKADLRRLGDQTPPQGPVLAVRVANLDEKEVLMMDPPEGFFDIEHFSGYPAVLIKLNLVKRAYSRQLSPRPGGCAPSLMARRRHAYSPCCRPRSRIEPPPLSLDW